MPRHNKREVQIQSMGNAGAASRVLQPWPQLPVLAERELRHSLKVHPVERLTAALALLAVTPLLAACALAIVISDRGPVFFRQRRIGKFGRPFLLLKLRSMKAASNGHSITAKDDMRITTPGRFMRDYKIDELPQLWNVLRGEMSIIGPRPEVPEYVDLTDVRWQTVVSAPPGLTDLASLVFRHEEQMLSGQECPEKFYREWLLPRKLDLSTHYMHRRSLKSDLRLIGLTLKHIVSKGEHDRNQIARQFDYRGAL